MATFRLDCEPWIPILRVDGTSVEVSLTEVFTKAGEISELDGTPLEVAAITRFLLAICHLTETPTSLNGWHTLWTQRASYMKRCADYVENHSSVWDLFNPKLPFGQEPGLEKTLNPAHILVYEAARKNNLVLADHSIEDLPARIRASKLARGLITTNAYAGSSGGGYRSGPLAMRSVAVLCGSTLDETLLLNLLVQSQQPSEFEWTEYGHLSKHDFPQDIVHRYLWTSRRVLLNPEPSHASARTMLLAPGNEMSEVERRLDPMVVQRRDAKGTDLVPLRLEADRALWRNAHVILSANDQQPGLECLKQLSRLANRGLIPLEAPVYIRVCAVAGDAQGPSSELWRDERLPFGLSILIKDDLFARVVRAVEYAEKNAQNLRKRIYGFCLRYIKDGADSTPDKTDISRLSDELAPNLTAYWSRLAQYGERIACDDFDEETWKKLVNDATNAAFRCAVHRLPPTSRRFRAEFART